mgnify:CR=1 FL=1
MGMHQYDIDIIEKAINFLEIKPEECFMAELGNQRIRHAKDYWDKVEWEGIEGGLMKGSSKYYFSSRGINHTSFDLNNKDGAIPIDLTKPIPEKYVGQYNIISNIGTTEHTDDQYGSFNNIDKFCCKGGVMVHNIPALGSWPGHANAWYTTEFFEELAKLYDYDIIALTIQQKVGDFGDEDYRDAPKEIVTVGIFEFVYTMLNNLTHQRYWNKSVYKEKNIRLAINGLTEDILKKVSEGKSLEIEAENLQNFIKEVDTYMKVTYEKTQVDGSRHNNVTAILRKKTEGVSVSRQDFDSCKKFIRNI